MKKIILSILFLLMASQGAGATITYLSTTCSNCSSASTCTTPAMNTTGASLIVISVGYYPGGSGINAPVDSTGSNTYTYITNTNQVESSNNLGVSLYYVSSPFTSSSQTFTENGNNSSYPNLCAMAFSGTSTLDQSTGANTNGYVYSLQTGSVTPSANNEVAISAGGGYSAGPSAGTPYLIDGSFNQIGTTGIAYQIQTTATAVNPTWTLTNTGYNTYQTANIATFKSSASAVILHSTELISNGKLYSKGNLYVQ